MHSKKLKLQENAQNDIKSSNGSEESANQALNLPIITFELMFWEKIWKVECDLAEELMEIDYKSSDKKIAAIYNPLDYAADLHCNYLKKFLRKAPEVLFLGMNPGLNGMVQSSASHLPKFIIKTLAIYANTIAVPFGHIPSVKNWMKLSGVVGKPVNEIQSKPVKGLECTAEEPSGKRFWGVLQELCGEPENFFNKCFVHNICPLAFLSSTGSNITPTEIKGSAKAELNTICLKYLKSSIEIFNPKIIIAIGNYANDKVKELKKKNLISQEIECKLLPHPSPRSLYNQNWVEKAHKWYSDHDILPYFNH